MRNPVVDRALPIVKIGLILFVFIVGSQNTSAFASSRFTERQMSAQTISASILLDKVAIGQRLRLDQLWLDGEKSPSTLALERFEVFTPGSRVLVHDENGSSRVVSIPKSAYYRGEIQGYPTSKAVLSVDASGQVRGIVHSGEHFWILGEASKSQGLASVEVAQSGLANVAEPFQCDSDSLPQTRGTQAQSAVVGPPAQALLPGETYEVVVAIETDAEFYDLFGDVDKAVSYIGGLFAYASSIYRREISTNLLVGDIFLWIGGSNSDPWQSTTTEDALDQFQNFWNNNRKSSSRSTAHFLSGRPLGGGLAYREALCDQNAYGVSGDISGDFSIKAPQSVWDIIVVSHEIGHNFGSKHTHVYQNIGGDSNPVDQCWVGSDNPQGGKAGYLPGINALSGGAPGSGTGTIMSYCHQISPYFSNISLTFGKNHSYGIKASRVNDIMGNYVGQVAAAKPSCITKAPGVRPDINAAVLAVINGLILDEDAFVLSVNKSGSGTVTSSPAGIDCGATCAASFDAGTQVTLTAQPASGYQVANWSGACSGSGACVVIIDSAKNVQAAFTSTPIHYALSVNKTGQGTVTSSPIGIDCGATCTASFNAGTQVTLTAQPSSGYQFAGWSGACGGSGACVVTMDSAKSVQAAFTPAPIHYALAVSKAGQGTVTSSPTGLDCGSTCTVSFNAGTQVTLTVQPASGFQFTGWSGACSGSGACVVTMDSAKSVKAIFSSLVRYKLSVNKTGRGVVTSWPPGIDCGASCKVTFDAGTQVTLTAQPASGYRFVRWKGACGGTETCSVTMSSKGKVTAKFKRSAR